MINGTRKANFLSCIIDHNTTRLARNALKRAEYNARITLHYDL